ncbi:MULTISPECIES: VOC family protein [Listeria]|uniref:VOC family protein n=1 Tax=Listeria TaxID=1637 RepID=UPI000B58A08C|nr:MULTISPECIES: VOC family protein [Listeria]
MIKKLGQVMVYIENQEEVARFWTEQVGFIIRARNKETDAEKWIEIAPDEETATTIVLQDKIAVAKMSPDMNLGTPSLLFYTDELDATYATFKENGVPVGELVDTPLGRVFNFHDPEQNYFAILEDK